MDSTVTSWAFGFGGWVGVLASTFMLINIPHNYTFSLVLLSPWVGGISMYLFMYLTHCWITISSQIAVAMVKYEIIMALMTSIIGVMVVAVARMIIDMERGHRTPAEQAAAESTASVTTEIETDESDAVEENETTTETSVKECTTNNDTDDNTDDEAEESGGDSATNETSGEESSGEESSGEESSGEESSGEESSGEEGDDEDDESSTTLNQARIEETSFENINTPQLQGIPNTSPIPKLPDM
jgi:hypothetical protein